MSTSVKDHSTTTQAVGFGRLIGSALAGLALAIAIGVGFAIAQGNDAPVSGVEARLDERAFQAETDRLTEMADHWIRNDPENYPTELKRLLAMIDGVNAQAAAERLMEQRVAHEFVEEQRSPSRPAQPHPLEGIAE